MCPWRFFRLYLIALVFSVAWIGPNAAKAQDAAWRNHMEVSVSAYQRGNYERALKELDAALVLAEDFEESDPRLLQTLLGLALIRYEQQDYDRAEVALTRTLGLARRRADLRQAELATAANALALVYMHTGRYAEAEPLFQEARVDFETLYGPGHVRTAQVIGNMAGLYQSWGRLNQSEHLYRQAVPLYEKAFGPRHPELAQLLESYSALLFVMGRPDEAEALQARADAIKNGN